VNVASAGLAVDAAAAAEKFKRALGPAAYAAGAIRAGLEARPVRASVAIGDDDGGDEVTGRVWQVLVGATGRFGGGSGLGNAVPGSPKLTVAWVPAGTRATLPVRAIGLRSRTIERQPGVESWQSEHPVVHATRRGRPAAWNLDGERWEPTTSRIAFEPIGPVPVVIPGD
jgi:diacylglycerol kinase family enzyme